MRTGVRVDIRLETKPTVVADCRRTPFADESFRWIMIDSPYSKEFAERLYGTGKHYPRPGAILKEAARLLVPGGRVGILHFILPPYPKSLRRLSVNGIMTGTCHAIRAWSVFEKVG
jgi:hypothetical protein